MEDKAKPTYRIRDSKTKEYVSDVYQWKSRNRARARADRLNMEYGGYRYFVDVFWPENEAAN